MEKRGGDWMVNTLKWTTVSYNEVKQAKFRFEASVFNIEAKAAKEAIDKCSFEKATLCGENGLAKAYHRGRFKRIYVEKSKFPIYQPSQITEINPRPILYLSEHTKTDIEALRVKKNQILMTCSGTIGKCTIVTGKLINQVFSHDLLRITAKEDFDTGYIYSFFKTDIGQLVLQTNNYGAVIQHIEPEHLEDIIIPKPSKILRQWIHNSIMKSFALRDESNGLIDEAEKMLIDALNLSPIEKIKEEYYKPKTGIKNYTVRLNLLDDRLDASYHLPVVNAIIDQLLDNAENIVPLESLVNEIIKPNIFKRIYTDSPKDGILFLGNKDFLELAPNSDKYIAKNNSKMKSIYEKELFLKENNILISCRGTIGYSSLLPKYFEKFAISDNIIRISLLDEIAGYIYIFLNSDYGKKLIVRETYGSVIDVIDPNNIARTPIPKLKNKDIERKINNLALQANQLRSKAYYLEQIAVRTIEIAIKKGEEIAIRYIKIVSSWEKL